MKKLLLGSFLSFSLLLGSGIFNKVTAQVVVVKPKKTVVVKKGHRPGKHYVWRAGGWVWKPGVGKYVWRKGVWVKGKPGRKWKQVHWVKAQAGWKWVPGHW